MSQIIIGYTSEGTTDVHFLSSIILRTFVEIGFECQKEIEVIEPIVHIKKENGLSFSEQMLKCSKQAHQNGVMAFCIHVDADSETHDDVLRSKIHPTRELIGNSIDNVCKNLVPIIPIQMTESWMLADKQLLKDEIGTEMGDNELGINRNPEEIADPKQVITDAIRLARAHIVKRRRKDLTITELYQPLGQKISLKTLSVLPSFENFKESVRAAYRTLNYLQ